MRELAEVLERCRECGSAKCVLIHEHGLDEEGRPVLMIFRDVVPHTRSECQQMVTLSREAWPTLW